MNPDKLLEPPVAAPHSLRSKHIAIFPSRLTPLGVSLLVTTYQTGKTDRGRNNIPPTSVVGRLA